MKNLLRTTLISLLACNGTALAEVTDAAAGGFAQAETWFGKQRSRMLDCGGVRTIRYRGMRAVCVLQRSLSAVSVKVLVREPVSYI
jgi:hypothetical protein